MASNTSKLGQIAPHVALFPCSGIGHLVPFLRLAAMVASRGCTVTVITLHTTVSAAESDKISTFFALHPHIRRLEFQTLSFEKSKLINEDPFFMQNEAINNSVHLLGPLLASLSPPLSAILADFAVASSISQLASDLSISAYVVATTSATFFSVMVYLPQLATHISAKYSGSIESNGHIEHPGLGLVPISSIPPPMLNPNHFFAASISSNISCLCNVKGILMNTFDGFESEPVEALNNGRVVPDLAPILTLGPLESFEVEQAPNFPWLDEQAPESVVFVSFGSRTALPKGQIIELGNGIEKSGCKFLWVLKASKVDRDDKEDVREILGESFFERTKEKGMVIKGWVNQDQILAHPAIGGFISHCGWNSVMESARFGVPILAWPQHGDQMANAEVVEKAGLGLWVKDWGWGGEKLVTKDDVAEKIKELMVSKNLRDRAKEVKEKARQARDIGGTSESLLQGLIEALSLKEGQRFES